MTKNNAVQSKREYEIGFIGVGNMGAAILRGVCAQLYTSEQISITDTYQPKVDELVQDLGVKSFSTIKSLVSSSNTILCAVKPNNFPEILSEIASVIRPDQLLVSIVAGTLTETIESYFSVNIPVVRVMPNLPASVGCGVHAGLSAPVAKQLAIQTVLGASQMLAKSEIHPAVLKGQVTTPAGTTAAGLFELEKGQLRSVIASAILAAKQRSSELSEENQLKFIE